MEGNSKPIYDAQIGTHPDLLKGFHPLKSPFQKPVSESSRTLFNKICISAKPFQNKIILDACCGVGLSSFTLAKENSDVLIVGVDKSLDRVERNNSFKDELPANVLIERGNIIDLWYLLSESKEIEVVKHYLLYPNPYPKSKHLKLRWYGHFIFPYLLNISDQLEVRSNWKQYLEDFLYSAKAYNYEGKVEVVKENGEYLTMFERKYCLSGQDVFILDLKR